MNWNRKVIQHYREMLWSVMWKEQLAFPSIVSFDLIRIVAMVFPSVYDIWCGLRSGSVMRGMYIVYAYYIADSI